MPFSNIFSEYQIFIVSQVSESSGPIDQPGIWRDSIWQSVGVIVAIITFLLGAFIGWKQLRRKSLSYSVTSNVKILNVAESIRAKVKITYESKPIQDLYLVVIRFVNSGNTPIPPTDYFRALTVNVNNESEILSAEIIKESPDQIGVVISHTSKVVEVLPVLLNQKDSFEIKLLATNFQELRVDGRIAGIKTIVEKDDRKLYDTIQLLAGFTAATVGFVGSVIAIMVFLGWEMSTKTMPGLLFFIMLTTALSAGITSSLDSLIKFLNKQ